MKTRNFVAKHSKSCGAGRHKMKNRYTRKLKHKNAGSAGGKND